MGITIHSTSSSFPTNRKLTGSAIKLSVQAVNDCLQKGDVAGDQIGVFINAGVYRDQHIGEPAIATLVHGAINPVYEGTPFCFDINNGGIGFLNALEVCNGMILDKSCTAGIVFAADALPREEDRSAFPYYPAAGAVLLKKDQSNSGFIDFFHRSFPEFSDNHTASLDWYKTANKRSHRHILQITSSRDYSNNCLEAAKCALNEYLHSKRKAITDYDLMVTCQSPPEFHKQFTDWLQLSNMNYIAEHGNKTIHTASLPIALNTAMETKQFQASKNILMLTVGAGIQVSIAHFKNDQAQ